jgi:hypothetical protein
MTELSKAIRAYKRTEHVKRRRELLESWGSFATSLVDEGP